MQRVGPDKPPWERRLIWVCFDYQDTIQLLKTDTCKIKVKTLNRKTEYMYYNCVKVIPVHLFIHLYEIIHEL